MLSTKAQALAVEIDLDRLEQRVLQIIPGLLSWTTLIGLTILAFVVPFWISIFIIAYDIYVLVRVIYMSIHLIYAYRQLKLNEDIDWVVRCAGVSGNLQEYLEEITEKVARATPQSKEYIQLLPQQQEILTLIRARRPILHWQDIHHIVVLPTYNESLVVLRASLQAIAASDFPLDHLHIVVGFEQRVGEAAARRAAKLQAEFGQTFGTFLTTFHPDGLKNEKRVKSANATWAIQHLEEAMQERHIPVEHIIVSNFDSDTVVSPSYFPYLTYIFITHPDRYRVSYQPIPVYNNNLWDAPAFSRVIATGSTFWQMIESTRPERLVTFSSHSMSLKALHEVHYWQKDIISEDSRIFWQCLLKHNGQYRTQPLYITVSMDAALASSWWQTLQNQYKQKRRWAWGIENFPYFVSGFLRNKKIPWRTKARYIFRTLEGHYSWATAPIMVAGLGWLPVLFGGPAFQTTVLSYNLPYVTRTLMSIAMTGLIVSASLSLALLPSRPTHYSRWRYVTFIIQWTLVPVIATLLSAFPALDAETRLMLGRDLQFNVMQKSRKNTR